MLENGHYFMYSRHFLLIFFLIQRLDNLLLGNNVQNFDVVGATRQGCCIKSADFALRYKIL